MKRSTRATGVLAPRLTTTVHLGACRRAKRAAPQREGRRTCGGPAHGLELGSREGMDVERLTEFESHTEPGHHFPATILGLAQMRPRAIDRPIVFDERNAQ